MKVYLFSFIFLAIPAIYETENYPKFKKANIFYLTPFLILFIGLRDGIGCDWESYFRNFNIYSNINFIDLFTQNNLPGYIQNQEGGYSLISILIGNFTNSFYIYNFILSFIFSIPLIYFCSKLKRPFLSLLISFPYFITVIGMGPLKQSLAISFLILAFIDLKSNNIFKFYFFNLISILFHRTSIIFFLLPFFVKNKSKNLNLIKKKFAIIILFFFVIFSTLIQMESFMRLIHGYFYVQAPVPLTNTIFLWIIVCFPSISYLLFRNRLRNLEINNNMWEILSISSIFILLGNFISTTITLRLILYFYPLKLFLISNIPDINLLNINKKMMCYLMIIFSSIQLITWLVFANHAYCWVPYKNVIFSN